MSGFGPNIRVSILILFVVGVVFVSLYNLWEPVADGCTMTYMQPNYIPISSFEIESLSSSKYGLYLYHEGWGRTDLKEHLNKLSGTPVLYIPGNGGSYKQVRSLGAESHRAYVNGPLEHTIDHEDADSDVVGYQRPKQYASMLDWFTVDLEGEHSAMDVGIVEEQAECVVNAIHKILDLYRESYDARTGGGAIFVSLPKSVILVGHSMGGFVARAATVHPRLRKSAVETIVTLSAPHQSPLMPFQPSMGHYFAKVNQKWKDGYEVQNKTRHHGSDPALSHVVVIAIGGGYNDVQVRGKVQSLDNVVPPTHGFVISSAAMKNVWLSMDHQVVVWCNQLVVQMAHTLLNLIDFRIGFPFPDTKKRLAVFTRMLCTEISHDFSWTMHSHSHQQSISIPVQDAKYSSGSLIHTSAACSSKVHWNEENLEKDLYIETTTVIVLTMDGRRRWLDIQKLVTDRNDHFIFVTNLEPCSEVRLHLWPEKNRSASSLPLNSRILDVTSKMMPIPSRSAPRQMGQPPPTALFWLGPKDMHGFRFLTISVAPLPILSGRHFPTSMAVGQFFRPEERTLAVSSWAMLQSFYSKKEMLLNDHPLGFNLSFSISLGLLPVTLSLKPAGYGIKNSRSPEEEAGDVENSRLCESQCFPPVALAWDATTGLHAFPNFSNETIVVESSPTLWSSTTRTDKTTVILLVDPRCSYKASMAISVGSAAGRLLLLHSSKIICFSVTVIFYALLRQAYAWDLDLPVPSVLKAVESNLSEPSHFFLLAILPIFISLLLSCLMSWSFPRIGTFIGVCMVCYILANGLVAILILISHFVFYATAIIHVFLKIRLERFFLIVYLQRFIDSNSGFWLLKVTRVLRANSKLVIAISTILLAWFVHPAIGLLLLVLSHAGCGHTSLCRHFLASFCSRSQGKDFVDFRKESKNGFEELSFKFNGYLNQKLSAEEECASCRHSSKSFGDTQLDMFHHHHGLLMLNVMASSMFGPSLWVFFQRLETVQSFPWFLDSALCICAILHGVCNSQPIRDVKIYFLYLIAGYWSYFSGLDLAPYRIFYPLAVIGVASFSFRSLERWKSFKGTVPYGSKKHAHKD